MPLPGGRRLPVCARCLGLYPLTFVLLILQVTRRLDLSALDPLGLWLLPLPTVVQFLGEQLGRWRGTNAARIAAAIPLAVGMSRMFTRYLAHPLDPVFWEIVSAYGGVCGLVAAFRFRARLRTPGPS